MAVSYVEKKRNLSIAKGEATATRVLEIAGTDLEALCVELLGCEFMADFGFSVTKRARHPSYDWMSVDSIAFEPGEPENPPGTAGVEYALLDATVTYKANMLLLGIVGGNESPTVPSGTFLSVSRQATAEMMTLPGHGFVWNSDGAAVAEDVDTGIIVPTVTHDFTWHGVTDPPWTNLRKYLGTVNVAGTPFGAAVAETWLFAGYSGDKDFTSESVTYWNLGMTFIEKYIDLTPDAVGGAVYGWNHFWRPNNNPNWDRLKNPATNSSNVYPQGNHNNIFRFA